MSSGPTLAYSTSTSKKRSPAKTPVSSQLELGLVAAAAAVLVPEPLVRELGLRVAVEQPQVRVGRRGVEVEVLLLHVLAVVPLLVGQAEQSFLEHRVLAVPQGERQARALVAVGKPGQAVLAPAVGAAVGVVEREVGPGVAVGRVVLADGPPGPVGQVRAPAGPVVGRVAETVAFGDSCASRCEGYGPLYGAAAVRRPYPDRMRTFRSLRHPNYRLYFAGQLVSLVGSWTQITTLIWLAHEQTHAGQVAGVPGGRPDRADVPARPVGRGAGRPGAAPRADRPDPVRLPDVCLHPARPAPVRPADRRGHAGRHVRPRHRSGHRPAGPAGVRPDAGGAGATWRTPSPSTPYCSTWPGRSARPWPPFLLASAGAEWCFVVNALSYLAVIGALLLLRRLARRVGL